MQKIISSAQEFRSDLILRNQDLFCYQVKCSFKFHMKKEETLQCVIELCVSHPGGVMGVEKAIPAGINPLHALTLKSQSLLSYACDCVLVTIITLLDTQDNFSALPSTQCCSTELKPSVSIFIGIAGGLIVVGVVIHNLFATRS